MVAATAQEHLTWCVKRAMEYANAGDLPQAWASFTSDVLKHPETAFIATHELFGMAMFSGTYKTPRDVEDFFSGWAV